MKKNKVFYILSHPIQYKSPLLAEISKDEEIDLTVYYLATHTIGGKDEQFGKSVKWDIPLFAGYRYKFLKNWSQKPSVSDNRFFGIINPGIIKLIFKNKPDAIILHGWGYFTNLLALFLSKMAGVKVLVRGESPYIQEVRQSKFNLTLKKILLQNLCTGFLYIGTQNKLFYQSLRIPDKKLFYTPYCVDNSRFQVQFDELGGWKDKLREELKIANDAFVVLFSGKYIHKKEPLFLLQAFECFTKKNPRSCLVMVGEGELRPKMEEFILNNDLSGQVNLTGFVNQSEIAKYYLLADLFVLPSGPGETWGLVINEAMNFKLPLLVSDMVGSAVDLVVEGKNGFSFNYRDQEDFLEKLQWIKDHPKERKEMGEVSAAHVNNFSIGEVVRGIKEALKSL